MSTSAPTDHQLTDGAETLPAEEVIARMVERFHPRLVLASSFQQEESVLIDLLMRVEPQARI
ncbi:MAG TPA: phosphoadenosine phosphosulfate reductase, partial [Conexibacter sp.]|nr:phosphoadenosine phosphosulfate reductase [Conexibacter sp.]